jgi:hypothetical protein
MMIEGHLFKLEIGNYIGGGKHFNVVADSLGEAWKIFFRIAVPNHVYDNMYEWNVTYLGKGKLIDSREEGK